jgi:hypothetical protein
MPYCASLNALKLIYNIFYSTVLYRCLLRLRVLTTDTLPSNVPKLDVSGANWAIWSLRFFVAIDAKGKWGHFDDTRPRPLPALNTPLPALTQTVLAWNGLEESDTRYIGQDL